MHNMDLCGPDIPTVPGKLPPVQLPLPIPAPLHAPHKGSLGSAVLSKDMEIGDICSDVEAPRLHRAKGWASHPSDFFCKYTHQLHTGRGERVFRHHTEVSVYKKAPLHSGRSVSSCYQGWSHKLKVGLSKWHPNSSGHIQHQHPPPALQGPSCFIVMLSHHHCCWEYEQLPKSILSKHLIL